MSEWRRRYEDGWAHDLDALERSLRPDTRLMYINQPHNPTGTLMDRATFERVSELARSRGLVLFADEVYRELEHDPETGCPRRASSTSARSRSAASRRATDCPGYASAGSSPATRGSAKR